MTACSRLPNQLIRKILVSKVAVIEKEVRGTVGAAMLARCCCRGSRAVTKRIVVEVVVPSCGIFGIAVDSSNSYHVSGMPSCQ